MNSLEYAIVTIPNNEAQFHTDETFDAHRESPMAPSTDEVEDPIKTAGTRVATRIAKLGLLRGDVAKMVGMTPDAFSRSLNLERQFKLREIAQLSDVLDVSIHWLITGERDPREVKLSARHQWNGNDRADVVHPWKDARRITTEVANLYNQVELGAAGPAVLAPAGLSGADAALWSRQQLLKEVSSPDAFATELISAIERAFNIDVLIINSPDDFKAYSVDSNGTKMILLKAAGSWWQSMFNLAHELGHLLHDDLAFSDDERQVRDIEGWVNGFAAELLMPASIIGSFDWPTMTKKNVGDYVASAGVSTLALGIRLKALRLMQSLGEDAREALALTTPPLTSSTQGMFWSSPLSQIFNAPRFPARLINAHRIAIDEKRIGGQSLAWMLRVPIEEVDPSWTQSGSMSAEHLLSAL